MKNELEGMEMSVYPAFYCYKGSEKGVYTGDFSAESVITWAKETCKAAANSKTEL
jgi:phosphodiesterase/alkaline phosphatase D-like protein